MHSVHSVTYFLILGLFDECARTGPIAVAVAKSTQPFAQVRLHEGMHMLLQPHAHARDDTKLPTIAHTGLLSWSPLQLARDNGRLDGHELK